MVYDEKLLGGSGEQPHAADPGVTTGFDASSAKPDESAGLVPRAPSARAARGATIAVLLCIAGLVALAVLGSILTVGDRLAEVNIVLGIVFYLLVGVLVAVGVVYPLASIAARPVFSLWRLRDGDGKARQRWCRRLVEHLEVSVPLDAPARVELRSCLDAGDEADDRLIAFFNARVVPTLDLETKRAAKTAFFATAVSQSALVDAVTMLSINFNLVRAMVEHSGFRPSAPALARLYIRVMAGALVAGGLEDMDMEDLLSGLVGGAVPGAVVASATQGLVNAFLVYRVGVMTKRYLCAEDGPASTGELRSGSYREALALMRSSGFAGEVFQAVRDKAARVATGAVNAAKSAAVNVGRSACDAAANVGRSACDAVADAARRLTDTFARKSGV